MVQLCSRFSQPGLKACGGVLPTTLESVSQQMMPIPAPRESELDIVLSQTSRKFRQLFPPGLQSSLFAKCEPAIEFVDSLGSLRQHSFDKGVCAITTLSAELARQNQDPVSKRLFHPGSVSFQLLEQALAGTDHDLGCGRRRRCPMIRDEVRDCEVCFVTDR
jgi:hypothetical protein